ncbi:uncharacterized protein LOC110060261 isoform X1 [Orbicella faveolata]|uniref:uncharacterized protein LOC110060261 isoform X1 n=1 Tax=Orbicella faveolata TaxID=48498 RepID=UPI0009E40600|nr:uncharacterized protein LOC110060261 isoform X1 [Orbicella faveolata]
MEVSVKSAEGEVHKEKKHKKRKQKELDPKEDVDILNDNSGSVDLTAIQNICTCFGIGGLYNAKKRLDFYWPFESGLLAQANFLNIGWKIESKAGLLAPLNDDWSPVDEIQNLPPGMKQRYAKEMSEKSFQLLGLIKRVSQLFKKLHEGRKYTKDVTMDVYLKDVKTKPSLPPPDQYIEIGLWRQVMQINQQICRKMEELDKMDKNSPDISKESGSKKTTENKKENESKAEDNTNSFRDFYMEMVTSNFGDDLDRLRQEGNLDSKKVEMLIKCLETGKDIWTDLERSLLQSTGS